MKNKQIQKKIKKSFFAVFALLLIFAAFGVTIAAADTSVAWTKDIGDVTAADMSEDGSVIYAAVGSQIFVYDAAGVQQNVFTVGGNVVKLVCSADGSKAALYTDGNEVNYIDSGALTWSKSFTAITDIDISNAGSVLVVESGVFHKYMPDGSIEYTSNAGTYSLGAIDPDDEFAVIQSGNTNLQKYILTTTDHYWATINNNTFNTNFQDFQNVILLYTNETSAIILNNETLGDEIWSAVYGEIGVSDLTLTTSNAYNYYDSLGTSWTQVTSSAGWTARTGACSWVFDNKMWIACGLGGNGFNRDVWSSEDGVSWTQETSAGITSIRSGACSWVFDNKMWIAGGKSAYNAYNDVWVSEDGVSWTKVTSSAGWAARAGACSWVFDNKMWIAGGNNGNTYYNDIWSSEDGVSWTQVTSSAGWTARTGASSWVFDNKIWIAGGNNGNTYYRDVWYSVNGNPYSWNNQATSSAGWAARTGASSWVYNGKMWIAGGNNGNTYYNDIWSSVNGTTWTRITSSAGWAARTGASSWVFDNKIWIAGGNNGNTYYNDITNTADPYIIIKPSQLYPTYVFYNYTGSPIQHTQTTYNNAVPFTGVTEQRGKPTFSLYDLQTTKTLTGNIQALSLSDRGDWLGTLTSSNVYHDQITNAGFGTEYSDNLGSTGTAYDIATANSAAMSVVGQGQTTDIYSMSASRVGTYTAGGIVTHVDIADKNALWAASGGEDGKVYVFSKDASSNWYLEYSSDSENPITALRMSARGEYVLAGRTNSLTLYQTNTPVVTQTDFWFTLYAYKDSDSYRNAAVNVSVYQGNQWNNFAQGLTDSAGKYVVQLTAGQNYKFEIGNGEKILIYMASPSVTSQTVSIYSSPISTSIEYNAVWDSSTNSINFNYTDTSAQTEAVTVKIVRTDNWNTVYDQTFNNQQTIQQSLPIIDDTTSYKVEFSVRRVSGVTRNTFIVSSSRDIIPIPLDQNIKNILFCGMLFVIAGLFSYLSAFRGPIVVSLVAGFFIYIGWVTIPWEWFVITIAVAIVASMSQRRS